MKKNIILKVISVVLIFITVFAAIGAITVTDSGFLDLSNIVRAVCIGMAIICEFLAVVAWKCSKPNH